MKSDGETLGWKDQNDTIWTLSSTLTSDATGSTQHYQGSVAKLNLNQVFRSNYQFAGNMQCTKQINGMMSRNCSEILQKKSEGWEIK